MHTIYVFDNEFIGEDENSFKKALIDQFSGSQTECENWFSENYCANDYSYSFTEPQ